MSALAIPVEEYTTPNPITVTVTAQIAELFKVMNENGIRHLPVVNGSQVVGVISERDLQLLKLLGPDVIKELRAQDIMVPEPVTVEADTPVDQVAFMMSEKKIGSVMVNDSNQEFLGVFTVTDALNALIEVVRENKNS